MVIYSKLSVAMPLLETYQTNVMGTVNLLEALRQCDATRVIINVTTDKCYENKEWCWGYREDEPVGGLDPYSNSKACSELVTTAYRHSYFNPEALETHGKSLASARSGNVIGGGDWSDNRLIPDFIRACINEKAALVRSPHSTRPWQFVLESLGGYMRLAESMWHQPQAFAQAWNFGPYPQDIQTVTWVIDKMTQLWGEGASWQLDTQSHPHEASLLQLDISKAQKHLNWKPIYSIEKTLNALISWYKAWLAKEDMRKFTINQILDYEKESKHDSRNTTDLCALR